MNIFVSTGAGGNWNSPSSWLELPIPGGIPAAGDSVIITSGSSITITTVSNAQSINIQSGGSLDINALVTLSGSLQLDGSSFGLGEIDMTSAGNMFISGSHTNSFTSNIVLRGGNVFIASTVVINNNPGYISLSAGTTVTNKGTITTSYLNSGAATNWINAANSFLTIYQNCRGPIAITASAAPNTVTYSGLTSNILPGTYYNLNVSAGGTHILTGITVVEKNMFIASGVGLNGNGFPISVAGNFTNNESSTNLTNVDITFNGAGVQSVSKTSRITETFRNLTISGGNITMANAINVLGDFVFNLGTLDVSVYNFALNMYGSWTNNGGNFNCGNGLVTFFGTTASNSISKPGTSEVFNNLKVNCTTGIYTLNSNIYVGKTITLSSGTLNGGSRTITLGGNWLNNGGTFAPATSTVQFQAASSFSITKTVGTETFNNFIKVASNTLTLACPISCAGNLTLSAGTLDVSASNYAISIAGNGTFNGTFTRRSGTVTFNGGGSQVISGTSATFANLTSSGANVTLGSNVAVTSAFLLSGGVFNPTGFDLSVAGSATFNGTYTQTAGNLFLNGSSNQSITGSVAATFFNIGLSNNSGATFSSGTYTVTNNMHAQSGVFAQVNPASITLQSDAVSTAYIGTGAGSFSGTFILQRYISGRTAHWQDFAVPVSNTTLMDWDNEMYMSGVGGPDGYAGTFRSVNTWNEATEADVDVTSEIPLTPMVGYEIWTGDDQVTWVTKAIDTRGTPNSGNQTIALSNTAGADAGDNRIGNPYNSHITWNNSLGTNVQATIYILQNGSYVAYGNGTDIPSHQGFLAYANAGGGSITFTEACKSATSTSSWGRQAAPTFDLSFKLSSPQLTDYYQENYIAFDDQASLGFDVDIDHRFIKSPEITAPSLCMVAADGKRLTRNVFSASDNESMVIPMKTTVGIDGNYILDVSGARNLNAYSCAVLEDLSAHKVIDLKQESSYSFNAKKTDSPDRFILHLNRKNEACEKILTSVKPADAFFTDNQVVIYSNHGSAFVKFDLDQQTKASVSVYDLEGRSIVSERSMDAFKETLTLNLPEAAGLYLVHVNLGGNHIVTKKIFVQQ